MRKILWAGVASYFLIAGVGYAQTTLQQTTTTTSTGPSGPVIVASPSPPTLPAPPPGTLSTSRTQYTLQPDGTRTKTDETTYRNSQGVADDKVTQTTTIAPPPVQTTNDFSTTTTIIKK